MMPGRFDGYVTDTTDGRFEAEMFGLLLGVFDEEPDAVDALRERGGSDPPACWRVALDGETRTLALA